MSRIKWDGRILAAGRCSLVMLVTAVGVPGALVRHMLSMLQTAFGENGVRIGSGLPVPYRGPWGGDPGTRPERWPDARRLQTTRGSLEPPLVNCYDVVSTRTTHAPGFRLVLVFIKLAI
jgi:hypothetical protein